MTAITRAKNALTPHKNAQPPRAGLSNGRKTSQVQGQPILSRQQSHAPTATSTPKVLHSYQSVTAQQPSACKPQIPRPPVQAEPENLQKLREENALLKQLNELPPVPTDIPREKTTKKKSRSSKNQSPSLPLEKAALSKTIAEAETVGGLVKVWNHLNSNAAKSALSMEDRFALKAKFAGRLNMISKLPGQARLITEKMLKVMIPNTTTRSDINHQILTRHFNEVFPENRRNRP